MSKLLTDSLELG